MKPSLRLSIVLSFSSLAACRDGSSDAVGTLPAAATSTGLAFSDLIGQGEHWLVTVPEAEQGRDLDGDGDQLDRVVHVLDLATGRATNTGLVIGIGVPRGDVVPPLVVAIGPESANAFAVGADESGMGVDRNGDGDEFDSVLALVARTTGAVTNLELAASGVVFCGNVLAFGVPENAQGAQDLDGDGVVTSDSIPHFHDLATGVTWNSGLRRARVLSASDQFVALAQSETVTGDQNGDGDALDQVVAFYDPATRTLVSSGLAASTLFGFVARPVPHDGRFGIFVSEADQGLGDIDGDGSANGVVIFIHDPRTGSSRPMLGLGLQPIADVAPFVLTEFQGTSMQPWLYDGDADRLSPTGWLGARVHSFGDRLAILVTEADQGDDLDGDGRRASEVPVLFDTSTGTTQNTGVDGFSDERGTRLSILSFEGHAGHDWNGDGDLADTVLHVWDPSTRVTTNTRLVTEQIAPFGDGKVTLLLSEAGRGADLNGDGDLLDEVAQVYDANTGGLLNLGLASPFLLGIGGDAARSFLPVSEADEERDLDGDGDQLDTVLFLVGP